MTITTSTAKRVRAMRWAVVPAALIVSGLVIGQASYAAFTSTTSNATNSWASGTVALSDDDAGTAMFTATNLKPGSTGTRCIVVTSTGTLASAVKLYGVTPATTNALSTYLDVTVVQGTGGTFGSCTGFAALTTGSSVYSGTLANFGTSATSFATGLGTWAPTGSASESRTFQITYTLNAAAPNSSQGGTASIGFTWEAQNT